MTRSGGPTKSPASAPADASASRPSGGVLYPDHYAWYIIASTLDIIVTHTILHYFGGREVNRVADALIQRFGEWGLVGLKFATVVIVVAVCEAIGRVKRRTGERLAAAAIAISCFPVGYGLPALRERWAW